MPGYILHVGAQVQCAHFAPATPMTANPRVKVGGNATVLKNVPYKITGCGNANGNSPCLTATWTTAATKVKSMGQPLVLMDSNSTSVPNVAALKQLSSQTRVKAV